MLRGAIAIFKRDFKKFLSNPFVLFLTLAMPIMYLLIFGNAIGGTITGIPIGVVQDNPYVTETPLYTHTVTQLEQIHESGKADTFRVIRYNDPQSAKTALEKGKLYCVVVFPPDISGNDPVQLYLDSSEYTIPQLVKAGVIAAVAATGAGVSSLLDRSGWFMAPNIPRVATFVASRDAAAQEIHLGPTLAFSRRRPGWTST